MIHGRFIPRLFSLIIISLWKGYTDTAAAGFDSDGQAEEVRLDDLLQQRNGKRHLDLVFDFYGPSSNFYWCDSESGLF